MSGMTRTLARYLLAAVLIAAHLPLPAARGKGEGHGGPMACCAPKSCCTTGHVCSMGGGCGGGKATGSGSCSRMIAGGCGDQAPQVTPIQLDPTVAAQVVGLISVPSTLRAFFSSVARCTSPASQPLVPPP